MLLAVSTVFFLLNCAPPCQPAEEFSQCGNHSYCGGAIAFPHTRHATMTMIPASTLQNLLFALLLLVVVAVRCSHTAATTKARCTGTASGVILSEGECVANIISGTKKERMYSVLVGGSPPHRNSVTGIQGAVLKHCPNSAFSRHYLRSLGGSWTGSADNATRPEGAHHDEASGGQRDDDDDAVDLMDSRRRSGVSSDSSPCDRSTLLSEVRLSKSADDGGAISVAFDWLLYWYRRAVGDQSVQSDESAAPFPQGKDNEQGRQEQRPDEWKSLRRVALWAQTILSDPVGWKAALRWLPSYERLADVGSMLQVDVRLTNFPISAAEFLSGGRRAVVETVRRHVDVIRFPALQRRQNISSTSHGKEEEPSKSWAFCDPRGLLLLERQVTAMANPKSDETTSATSLLPFSSWFLPASFGGQPRATSEWAHIVRSLASVDVCVPSVSGASAGAAGEKDSAQAVAAGGTVSVQSFAFLRRLLATEPVVEETTAFDFPKTSVKGDDEDGDTHITRSGRGVTTFNFTCSLKGRIPDGPFCVGLVVHRDSDVLRSLSALEVVYSSSWSLDMTWLATISLFAFVFLVRPVVLRFAWMQLALCTLLGVVILTVAVLYFIVKDFQRTRIGKVGLIALVTAGGWVALTDGIASAATLLMLRELNGNVYVQMSVVAAGVVSSIFAHVMLKDMLQRLTSAFLLLVLASLACVSWALNPEGTSILLLVALAYATGLARALVVIPCVLMGKMAWLILAAAAGLLSLKRLATSDEDSEPRETLPAEAHREVGYVRPKAAGLAVGRTPEERLKAFEDQGRICTRKALDELAARVRADPNKYAKVVRDPHGLARFAGVE